jgi:hypothetical protein
MDMKYRLRIWKKYLIHFLPPKILARGLAWVYQPYRVLLNQHEGFINVISSERQGTTFGLYFPAITTEIDISQEDREKVETLSAFLLGSTHADDAAMCTLGRVSVARMATVKPHGWVHASLERVRMDTSFPNWSELDNQILVFNGQEMLPPNLTSIKHKSLCIAVAIETDNLNYQGLKTGRQVFMI